MRNALINNIITGLAIVIICTVGLPFQLWADSPCTTEYGGDNEANPVECSGSMEYLPSGSINFKWNEHGENLETYDWELSVWGGATICSKSGSFGDRDEDHESDNKTCSTSGTGYWKAEFNFDPTRGEEDSAPTIIYYRF